MFVKTLADGLSGGQEGAGASSAYACHRVPGTVMGWRQRCRRKCWLLQTCLADEGWRKENAVTLFERGRLLNTSFFRGRAS